MAQWLRMCTAYSSLEFGSQHPGQVTCNCLYLQLQGNLMPLASFGTHTHMHIFYSYFFIAVIKLHDQVIL